MKLFLDANVIVSVLNKEYPVFTFSSRILSLKDNNGFQLYTSPLCLDIAFYFASKKSGESLAKKKIQMLSSHIQICSLDEYMSRKALSDIRVNDFEDGLQYYAALGVGCDVLVTQNKQDFYFSKIPTFDCEEFISHHF